MHPTLHLMTVEHDRLRLPELGRRACQLAEWDLGRGNRPARRGPAPSRGRVAAAEVRGTLRRVAVALVRRLSFGTGAMPAAGR